MEHFILSNRLLKNYFFDARYSVGVIVLIFTLLNDSILISQPKREVRAVWVTTNHRLDWPPNSYDPEVQKKALVEIFDDLKAKNFNTVFFQVRSQGTVLYKSKYEPWSVYLTGNPQQEPSYDPLQYAVEEAHKRNLEIHAWINVVNVKSGNSSTPFTEPSHIAIARPEWVRKYVEGDNVTYWLDVGFPEVRDYLKNICVEIVENYDVDGIHLDYIRYPGKDFDDSLSYSLFGQNQPIDDFRRENINELVAAIYDTIIAIRPTIKLGSAPIGIYENIPDARGWEGKHVVYQDSREWLKRKKHDYVVPQIYWDIKSNPRFDILVSDWVKNSFDKQVIIGIGAYDNRVLKEIEQQIGITRKFNAAGQSFFRYEHIKGKRLDAYKYPANIPPMKWKDSIPPEPPYSLSGRNIEGKLGLVELVWGIPLRAKDGDTVKYYNIYRGLSSLIDRENPAFILTSTQNYYYYDFIRRPSQLQYFYQVSSFDKGHNESLSATEVVKVELKNLKEVLRALYNEDKIAFNVEFGRGMLLIESSQKKDCSLVLYDAAGNKIKELMRTHLTVGLNYFEFEIPKMRLNKYTLKVFLPDKVEIIEFKL